MVAGTGTSATMSQAHSGPSVGSISASSDSCAAGTVRDPRVNRIMPSDSCTAPMKTMIGTLCQPIARASMPLESRSGVGSRRTMPQKAMRNSAFQIWATTISVFWPQRSSTE